MNICLKNKVVLVQYSGGKDSTACLVLLKNMGAKVEAIHFVHGYSYSLPTYEAKRICAQLDITLHIVCIEKQIKELFLSGFKLRPCRFCKAIMDQYTVNFAKNNHVNIICVGDTKDDTALVNRLESPNCAFSKYFNNEVDLPNDIIIYRPLLSYTSSDVYALLKSYNVVVQRVNDTGDKYFEYSREGCPLQFKDFGVAYSIELMDKLKRYNDLCSEFATIKGIRASIHLPSEFIVTIPRGYEEECYNYLLDKGCAIGSFKNTVSLDFKYSFHLKIYPELLQENYLKLAWSRVLERLGEKLCFCDQEYDYDYLESENFKIKYFIDRKAFTIDGFIGSKNDIHKACLENIMMEVFHTYDFYISEDHFGLIQAKKLSLDKVVNYRFVPCKFGSNWFIRSGSLKNIDKKDAETLVNLGVTDVIDLQTTKYGAMERLLSDYGIVYKKCIFDNTEIVSANTGIHLVIDTYLELLKQNNRIKNIFELLAEAEGRAVLCCKKGRDRTGVICIILELLSGCRVKDILQDYAASYKEYGSDYNNADAESIAEKVIEEIIRKYGSAEHYLSFVGLSSLHIKMIRLKLRTKKLLSNN